jgi:hypothetical protein
MPLWYATGSSVSLHNNIYFYYSNVLLFAAEHLTDTKQAVIMEYKIL